MLHVYDSDIFLIYVRIYLLLICGMCYQATVYINMYINYKCFKKMNLSETVRKTHIFCVCL